MQGSATIRVFCLPYTGELLKQSMHLWKVSPPGNVKKAEHRLRLCRQFAIALSSGRTEHCATWRAYCCSRHSLALVLVFMCEKHFLTQRQEPKARGATSLTRWELFPFLYGHGLRIASHRS